MALQEPDNDARTAATTVEAVVTLRVPRGAMGDLPEGVREVLAAVDGVRAVDVGEVLTVRPRSLDIRVNARAGLTVALGDDAADVREGLLDGFGVEDVDALVVDVG